ncbi:MAG: Gfo/Idh/MocA family oxidoreductase [Chloroflexota bacterium]
MASLRVGIIGANVSGWAGRAHLPAMGAGIPGVELVAVATTREESAKESAAKYGARLAFADYRELLASPEVDAVAVSVKLPAHHELTMAAIAAGKHVYTEWPLGTDTAQAVEMAAAAKARGVRTAVGLQSRSSSEYQAMARAIAGGYVGTPRVVTVGVNAPGPLGRSAGRLWMADAKAGANPLTITFGHLLDGLQAAAGPIASIAGAVVETKAPTVTNPETGATLPVSAPDTVAITGVMASGATLVAQLSSAVGVGAGFRLQVHGSEGVLTLEGAQGLSTNEGRLTGQRVGMKAPEELDIEQASWVGEGGLSGPPVNVGKTWERFAAAIAADKPFSPSFDDAVRHHQLIDAIRAAAQHAPTRIG